MAFQKGDQVSLTPHNNGTKAFQALVPGRVYTVEAVGNGCRATPNTPNHGTETVKIMGSYFCAEAFRAVSAGQSAQPAALGISEKRDPARDLNQSDKDFFDCLPDVRHGEKLPTYEELEDEWWKRRGYPNGRPSNNLP